MSVYLTHILSDANYYLPILLLSFVQFELQVEKGNRKRATIHDVIVTTAAK